MIIGDRSNDLPLTIHRKLAEFFVKGLRGVHPVIACCSHKLYIFLGRNHRVPKLLLTHLIHSFPRIIVIVIVLVIGSDYIGTAIVSTSCWITRSDSSVLLS